MTDLKLKQVYIEESKSASWSHVEDDVARRALGGDTEVMRRGVWLGE